MVEINNEFKSVKIKESQLDRLELLKVHPRQPLHEIIELLLINYEVKEK